MQALYAWIEARAARMAIASKANGPRTRTTRPAAPAGCAVRGAVQGVGFRPFIYDLATRMRLSGSLRMTRLASPRSSGRAHRRFPRCAVAPSAAARARRRRSRSKNSRRAIHRALSFSTRLTANARPHHPDCGHLRRLSRQPSSILRAAFIFYPSSPARIAAALYADAGGSLMIARGSSMAPFAMCPIARAIIAIRQTGASTRNPSAARPADQSSRLRRRRSSRRYARQIVATKGVGGFI